MGTSKKTKQSKAEQNEQPAEVAENVQAENLLECGLPKLSLDELFAIDKNSLNVLEEAQLKQIFESSALHADDIEAGYATGSSELTVDAKVRQVARDVTMLLNSNKYKIHAKNAAAIVRTNTIFSNIANSPDKVAVITNADYQNLLVAFGTEFEGNLHTAKTLTNVFVVLSEMSIKLQSAQQTVQELAVLYNAVGDVLDSRKAAALADAEKNAEDAAS